jgi:hypothetical protein
MFSCITETYKLKETIKNTKENYLPDSSAAVFERFEWSMGSFPPPLAIVAAKHISGRNWSVLQ